MISGKLLAEQLEKFLKSPVCQNARVMVKLPHGEYRSPDGYFDILSVSLMENNIFWIALISAIRFTPICWRIEVNK